MVFADAWWCRKENKEKTCSECYQRFTALGKRRYEIEQAEMQQEQEKRRQYTQKKQKERREIATAMAQGNVNRNERRFTAGEMSDEERSVWNFKLKLDTLSKAKLVDLCKAKSITGSHAKTKPELAWILMKIKHHGGPGRCPTCLQRSGSRSQTANGLAFFPRGYPARRHSRYTCGDAG